MIYFETTKNNEMSGKEMTREVYTVCNTIHGTDVYTSSGTG